MHRDGTHPGGRDGSDRDPPQGLRDLVAQLRDLGRRGGEVSVGDIRETIGNRSFGPFLLVPALIEISPIGGIPAVPTALAVVVALFAAQILFGRRHLWLPGFLERRRFDAGRFAKAMGTMEPVGRWADKVFRPRLEWLAKAPFVNAAALITLLLAASVPPLEIVPFASTLPMGAIAVFGLGLLARDGIAILVAGALSLASLALVYASLVAG